MVVCRELEELYPAYALDAITDEERVQVETHLAYCAQCARQVADYHSVADAIAQTVPQVEPPADLRARVLDATRSQRDQRAVRSATFFERLQFVVASLLRSPAFALTNLVLIVALGMWNAALQNQLNAQLARNQQLGHEMAEQRAFLNTIAYASDAPRRMQATAMAPQAVGRLYVAPDLNTLALVVYDLPALDMHRVYQVWLIDPQGERTSGGTFAVDHEGTGWLVVHPNRPLNEFQGVGITIEPRGGSPKPTGDRVLATTLRD